MNALYPWLQPYAERCLPQKARWSHAWLLTGAEGVGKYHFARWMAKTLLCEAPSQELPSPPCGHCPSCVWFEHHQHPDYHACVPENATETLSQENFLYLSYADNDWIKIDAIRHLQQRIYLPPHRQKAKIVLIYPADLLTPPTANALLKLLEEPPRDTYFLLIAHRTHQVLPTLRSRCHILHFAVPDPQLAQTWCDAHSISADMLAEAGGSPLKAATLKAWHDKFHTLRQSLLTPRHIDLDLWKQWIEKTPRAERRAALTHCIDTLQKMVHDWLSSIHGQPPRFFPNHQKIFHAHQAKISVPKLLELDHTLNSFREHSKHPLNPIWIVETLLQSYASLES